MIFYHVSNESDLDTKILNPRIPASVMNCENHTTKRISVSPSINGCLTATNRYDIGDTLYVYVCVTDKYIQPTAVDVIDSPLIGEFWITEPTQFEKFIKIEITDVFKSNFESIPNDFYAFRRLRI